MQTEPDLLLCSRGKLTVFTVLCEQYQPSLRRDPMYNEVRGGAAVGQAIWGAGVGVRSSVTPCPCPSSTSTG